MRQVLLKIVLVVLLTISSFTFDLLLAESVTIYGKDFLVDEIKTVDQETLQVTIKEQTAIIAKDSLQNYVLKNYLYKNQLTSETISQLPNLLEQSLKANDRVISMTALIGILENRQISIEQLLNLFVNIEALPSFPEMLKEALLSANGWSSNTKLAGYLLCYLIVEDYTWVKSKVLSYVYIHASDVKLACEERYAKIIVSDSLIKLKVFVDSLQDIFGATDSFVEPVQAHALQLIEGEQLVRGNDLSQVYKLVKLSSAPNKFNSAVAKMIVRIFHEQADILNKTNEPSKALSLLAWFDVNWRTDETHKLVLNAIRQLNANNFLINSNERALKFLEFLTTKDRSIKTNYIDALQRIFEESVEQGNFEKLPQIYSEISKIRTTDKTANNNLLALWAISLAKKGDLTSAKSQYQKISGLLGVGTYFSLLMSGIIIEPEILWLILAAVAIFLLLLVAMATRPKPIEYSARREYAKTSQELSGAYVRKIFEANQGNNSLWREYEDLMLSFGLTKNSSLRELKKAYRNLVKTAHPDANPKDFNSAQSDFLQISKDYERLIELRALLQVK